MRTNVGDPIVDQHKEGKEEGLEAKRPGRPPLLSDGEVLTLAILSQWPHFRSERDFWRFADAHLRKYFPALVGQAS